MSSYGLGVVLRAKSSVPIDGAAFAALARDGWRIECNTDLERRRVAGALAWVALGLPAEALVVTPKPWWSRMTPERFAALARLIRMRGGAAQEAARLVLVDGLRPADAARATALSQQAVCNAVSRVRRADDLLSQSVKS
jgi:hypothetical protein